jgi:hypothetical protein
MVNFTKELILSALLGALGVLVAVFLVLALGVCIYDRYRFKRKMKKLLNAGHDQSFAVQLSRVGGSFSAKDVEELSKGVHLSEVEANSPSSTEETDENVGIAKGATL